ncbi:venom allergen 5.02-like [Venturia canescens]|uniref:venom allergen 5.02-like n=1 Tax=Venturia canescens TaxID=32260 RepID=UPI001C9C20C9|nr:venom allergen 5.02-like [Venturia canescens]
MAGAIMIVNGKLSRNDYCNLKSCSKGTHTMCLFSPETFASRCGKVSSSGMTAAEIQEVVDLHNEFRAKVASGHEKRGRPGPQPAASNLGPLTWNPELAKIAQTWANQCNIKAGTAHDECRNDEHGYVGQNMALGPSSWDLSALVSHWYNEVEAFDRREVKAYTGKNLMKTGHYTQLVWAETTEIGCGVTRFHHPIEGYEITLLICNYGPGGNIGNYPIYQSR